MRRRKFFSRLRRRFPIRRRRRKKDSLPPYIRHWKNSKKADKVLAKLRSFEGPKIVPRVLAYLRKVDPFVFEEILLSALNDAGFAIERNRRYTGDGGIDGRIWDEQEQEILVQVKRYAGYVKPDDIESFAELVTSFRAAYGIFVHTGRTGPLSKTKTKPDVTIVSGNHLVRLLIQPENTWLRPPGNSA